MKKYSMLLVATCFLFSCGEEKSVPKKGIQVNEITEDEDGHKVVGISIDSLVIETRPRKVLITKDPNFRLTPVFKVNYHKKTNKPFIGFVAFHKDWYTEYTEGNNWNRNFMPGFSAVYGYNMLNVSLYNNELKVSKNLFESPVLINTLYYPAYSDDTLNKSPITREYYMVSVYDYDSNKDGFINRKDLRRLYHFHASGTSKIALIPDGYSVMSSEYDDAIDYMYVYARKDTNGNGQMDLDEPIDIFWIDLKSPELNGVIYRN